MELRPEVRAFAEAMERRLRENDHKGGWKNEGLDYLFQKLGEECAELMKAAAWWRASDGERVEDVTEEAADMANFAMMIADRCGALPQETEDVRFHYKKTKASAK